MFPGCNAKHSIVSLSKAVMKSRISVRTKVDALQSTRPTNQLGPLFKEQLHPLVNWLI